MRITLYLLLFFTGAMSAFAQIQPPKAFLGYELGEAFTLHHDLTRYIQHLASQSPRLKVLEYGKSYERRTQQVVFVSSPENLARLEEIRQNNLKLAGLLDGEPTGLSVPIIWLGYTVHGNEPAGTEASMALLHQLATDNSDRAQNWLKNLLIVIDPCQNPDGRERYAHWYQTVQNLKPDANPEGWEHIEPWARGRFNHYLYDLNRDWAWQTQVETQNRTALYRQWLPQVHIDLHEMGAEQSYFFGPPAHPIHPFASKWQREFSETIAKENKRNFDQRGEPYFTKEVYDFFYPSYGDTYPSLHGAVGLTYEQGGIRAGLAMSRQGGDTLRFAARIRNHWEASQNTLEASVKAKDKLLSNFKEFFAENAQRPSSRYKTYLIKHTNSQGKLAKLKEFLERNHIRVGRAGKAGKARGYAYHQNIDKDINIEEEDMLLSAYQPQSRLLDVLFEPRPYLEDSLTYDLTAWALPFAYGLEAYALEAKLAPAGKFELPASPTLPTDAPFAYIATWQDFEDVRFLSEALKMGIKIKQATQPFKANGIEYAAGTLVILRADNKQNPRFGAVLQEISQKLQKNLVPMPSGGVEAGKDFGSEYYLPIKLPKIALVGGEGTDNSDFGAVWYYLERDLACPVTVLQHALLSDIDLQRYDVVILPSGRYAQHAEKLMEYAKLGGRIIALDNAFQFVAHKNTASAMGQRLLKAQEERPDGEQSAKNPDKYDRRDRDALTESTAGAICKVLLDDTHPLVYGLGKTYYSLRLNQRHYPLLPKGHWNVGVYGEEPLVSGFIGKAMLAKIPRTFGFGVEHIGRGRLIFLPESPVFRGFWYNGKLLFANALFCVN